MADIVFHNGVVWTVSPDKPKAEALAIKGNRILKVGSSSEMERVIGDSTKVINLEGAFVLPGFIDSHTHFLDGGFSLSNVQLREAKTPDDFISRIQKKALELGEGAWILNGNWDHQQFDPPELPEKEWIDPVTPTNPVCVNRLDGHMVLVNSVALEIAGITKDTPAPEGGEILRDPQTGVPTGILRDAAMDLVTKHIPEPTLEEKIGAIETALKHANSFGVTSIHDMSYASHFEVYKELLDRNKLTARMYVYIPISAIDLLAGAEKKTFPRSDFLKIAGLKGFVDGSLGSSTALFFDPYADDPPKRGLLVTDMYPEGIMEKRLMAADRAGLQVAVHAIGDEANHVILDLFEKVMETNEKRDRRWRIEHAQHLIPEDFKRFGKLRVIASVQPYHAIDDGRWAEQKIGRERSRHTYAFRSLLENGAVLACGSDWTVAPINPLTGIYAAVTRRTLDGNNPDGWFPEQKIALEEAIKGYTLNAAFTEFAEHLKGSLEEGKLADVVILDQNLFEIPPEKILDTKVIMTILDGEIVYKN
ncbi:MAG: amidohydrolase [Candidatus Aminicenantes bacterium]|nr:MAG: amidohydrolase [Candidatus Aminicenantes bacterium]